MPGIVEPPTDDLVGERLSDKYRIVSILGAGGFGVVYEAFDEELGVRVAVKVLRSDACEPTALEEFRDEARRVTLVKHPNIVDWKAFSRTSNGRPYFVMEMLEGETLDRRLAREERLPAPVVAKILLQTLDALRCAHQREDPVLHLDLKPSNIFLESHPSGSGEVWVKVIDFGIGQFLGHQVSRTAEDTWEGHRPATPEEVTVRVPRRRPAAGLAAVPRVQCCTPTYAAPEHGAHLLHDQPPMPLDFRADLYSLGVIGYRMLTGDFPFEVEPEVESLLRRKLIEDPPRALSVAPRAPKALAAFIDRCLCRERDQRWTSTEDAYQALDRIVHRPRWRTRVAYAASTAAVVFFLLGLMAVPGRRETRFDLFRRVGTHRVDASHTPLYLGPRAREVGLDAELPGEDELGLRVVQDPSPRAPTVRWVAVSRDARGLHLRWVPTKERRANSVYLEARAGEQTLYSQAFDVVLLPDRKLLEDVFVGSMDGRRLDPVGQSLSIHVGLPAADVAGLLVEHDGRRYDARLVEQDVPCLYRLDLDRLPLPDGEQQMTVELRDRSGAVERSVLAVSVENDPLAIESADLEAPRMGERYVVAPEAQPVLDLQLSGQADVAWRLVHEDGRVLGSKEVHRVEGLRSAVDIPGIWARQQSFEGVLELTASDSRYVSRGDPERGRAEKQFHFIYSDAEPEVTLFLSSGPDRERREVDPASTLFTGEPAPVLEVRRDSPIPIRVEVQVCAPGDVGSAAVHTEDLVSRQSTLARAPLALEEGRSDVQVLVWRLFGNDAERPPDVRYALDVVVDTVPPWVSIADEQLEVTGDSAPGITVRVEDAAPPRGDSVAPPVALRWLLEGLAPSSVHEEEGRIGEVSAGSDVKLRLEPFDSVPDGEYRLRIGGTDAAGNRAMGDEIRVLVARSGPEIQVLHPSEGSEWRAHLDGLYHLEVRASDPNGVSSVDCEIEGAGGIRQSIALEVAEGRDRAASQSWTGSVRLNPRLSEERLRLRFSALDAYGCRRSSQLDLEAGEVLPHVPPVVEVRKGEGALARMHLVPGNNGQTYTFGGRGDEVERELLLTAGLASYDWPRVQCTWKVRVPPGAIQAYYLDETEVTVGQFLRFAGASDGFGDPSLWPVGLQPETGRREELLGWLRALDPDLPVTGISFDEAAAFATWSGRRLATFGEWEFALRGGLAYRASSFGGLPGDSRLDPAERGINVASSFASAGEAWPVRQGRDQTPDTGLWNLGSNVAEWTATSREALAPALPAGGFEEFFEVVDWRTQARASRLWIAGASFASPASGFLAAEPQPRSFRDVHVGFRCAVGLEVVLPYLGLDRPGDEPEFCQGDQG